MIKSKTELSLQELNEQIHMIVKDDEENDTSYFPNVQMVLESFENYLQCCEIGGIVNRFKINQGMHFELFQENVSSIILLKYQRFLNLLLDWEFSFKTSLNKLFSNKIQHKSKERQLHKINLTEIVFVMYLCLEIQRKEIIGKLQEERIKNMFLLKEIVKLLDQIYVNGKNKFHRLRQKKECSFCINQDKLVKILLLKALKIKFQRQNFSFSMGLGLKSDQVPENQKIEATNIKNEKFQKTLKNSVDENFSLISIESEYNKSEMIQEMPEKMKHSLIMISSKLDQGHFELERKNLSSQEIFKYISLNEFKGYIIQ